MVKANLTFFIAAMAFLVNAEVNTLSECEKQEGFNLLFDGTYAGFQANWTSYRQGKEDTTTLLSQEWKVDTTTSSIITTSSTSDIRSKQKYADFDLRLSFRNRFESGIYYRALTTANSGWETGVLYSVNETASGSNSDLYITGSAYDFFPAQKKVYHTFASGLWNEVRIVVKGNLDANGRKTDSVEHWLNGTRVVAFRYGSPAFWTAYAAHKWAGYTSYCQPIPGDKSSTPIPSGYIGFQADYNGLWKIRDVRINSTTTVKLDGYKFPPDACGVSNGTPTKQGAPVTSMSFEQVEGVVHVQLKGGKFDAVILMSLKGREISRSKVDQEAQSATLTGWNQPGVYIIKALQLGVNRHTEKLFLR